MENYELTLSEFFRIARKRKWIIAFSFFAVLCTTVIFTNMRPSVYEASVKIMVERNEDNQGALVWDIEPNLKTEVQVIKSFPVMRALAERIEKLPNDPKEREQAIVNSAFAYQNSIKVEQVEGSNIISITATADNPRKVALIVNTLADVYITEDVAGRQKQAQAVLEYVQKELDVQREQIIDNEARLHAFKQNEMIFIVSPEKKAALDRMSVQQAFKFEKDVLRIENEIVQIAAEKAKRVDSKLFSFIAETKPFEDVVFAGLNRRLLELEFERFLLLIDYTEEHPEVKAKTEEITKAKEHMKSLIQEVSGLANGKVSENDLTLVVDEMFLEDQKEVLVRIINKSYEESGALSSDQLKYLELKRGMENTLAAYERLLQKKEDANLSLVREIATITIISPATQPKVPISPNKQVNYMIGVLIGMLFALIVGFAAENIDTSISTIEDVERNIGFSVMGTIPCIHSKPDRGTIRLRKDKFGEQRSRLVTVFQPLSRETESFKTLRTNLVQMMRSKSKKVLLFTSAMQQEGKSTVAANVAVAMAELGLKTILIGANLRRPTMYKFFGISKEPGLSDILMGKIPWLEAVRNAADFVTGEIDIDRLINLRGIDNLRLITSGTRISNPSEALDFVGMDRFLSEVRAAFDVVIIDCPPVLPVTDALTLSSKVDGVVLVYRVAKTKRDMLRRAKLQLENVGADICGVVLNDIKKEEQLGSSAYYFKYDYADVPSEKVGMLSQSLSKISSIFI